MAKRERDPLDEKIKAIGRYTRKSTANKLLDLTVRRNTNFDDKLDELFNAASEELLDRIDSNSIEQSQIVEVVAQLGDLDPATVSDSDAGLADAKIAAYAALKPGEPIVHAYDPETRDPITGIIDKEVPLKVSVRALRRSRRPSDPYQPHRAPVATIEVPLHTNPKAKEEIQPVHLPLGSLPERLIGREALQRFITDDVKLAPGATSHPSIMQDLAGLRRKIGMLYELGMAEIDTTELDLLIESQQSVSRLANVFNSVRRRFPGRK